jgi:hypothetical protein
MGIGQKTVTTRYTRDRIPFRKNAKRKTVNGSVALAKRGSHGVTAVLFGRSVIRVGLFNLHDRCCWLLHTRLRRLKVAFYLVVLYHDCAFGC